MAVLHKFVSLDFSMTRPILYSMQCCSHNNDVVVIIMMTHLLAWQHNLNITRSGVEQWHRQIELRTVRPPINKEDF